MHSKYVISFIKMRSIIRDSDIYFMNIYISYLINDTRKQTFFLFYIHLYWQYSEQNFTKFIDIFNQSLLNIKTSNQISKTTRVKGIYFYKNIETTISSNNWLEKKFSLYLLLNQY